MAGPIPRNLYPWSITAGEFVRYRSRAHTSRGLSTDQVDRIQRDTAKLEQSEGEKPKSLKDNQVDVEQDKVL